MICGQSKVNSASYIGIRLLYVIYNIVVGISEYKNKGQHWTALSIYLIVGLEHFADLSLSLSIGSASLTSTVQEKYPHQRLIGQRKVKGHIKNQTQLDEQWKIKMMQTPFLVSLICGGR